MNNNHQFNYINKCLSLVESRFKHGTSQEWTNYDFEKLSEDIQEVTEVQLSITTLKRIFGKVKYDHAPSTATLNTLARYAGFTDWGNFRSEVTTDSENTETSKTKGKTGHLLLSKRGYWWAGGIVIALLLLVFIYGLSVQHKTAVQDPSAYQFSSNKVLTSGLPNSVIFSYDASAAGSDSVFITQSWDIHRKKPVSKDKHTYSSIYYYPGFFRAQLIVGGKVMKHHDLLIASKGWLAAVQQPETPVYFKKEEFLKDSMVRITSSLLDSYHLSLQPHPPTICLMNVSKLSGLQNDNFTFETTLKSDFKAGSAACQPIAILILCKNDVISIPLCAKGCVGHLQLYAAGRQVSSSENDLSGFGCDLTKWVTLKVEAVNKHIRFIVNGKEAYSLDFPHPPAGIVGVEYLFKGTATVKTAGFSNGKKRIQLL